MISEFEKHLYNIHLKISRTVKNLPFTYRKNFEELDEETKIILKKLNIFFKNYNNISIEKFFISPYKIYDIEDNYPLEFFLSQKAIKAYTTYIKQLEYEDPDSNYSLNSLQKAFNFVINFCKDKNLTLQEYYKYQDGEIPSFLDHLKNHKINFYTIHALTIPKPDVDSEILNFMFSDFNGVFQTTRFKFFSSKKMKEFAKQAKQKIETKLTNNKQNN